jgi:5-methylthioadenosine/S-adenosylhomocysteine deaminase
MSITDQSNNLTGEDLFSLINCTILTMDREDTYYSSGTIIIEEGRISEIGQSDKIIPKGTVIDMKQKIVLPGLINTHTHSPSPLFRGMADDLSLMDWLKKILWPAERNLTGDTAYWGTSLTCLEFIQSGITTFADQYFFSEYVAEAVQNSGLRGFIAPSVFTNGSPETSDTIQAAISFIEKYKGREDQTLVYPCIGPHAPYSCSDEILKEVARIADAYDLIIHTHISETMDENSEIYEATGLTPTQYLDSMGIFDGKVLAAHCIHLNQKDMQILKEKNVCVSYNPVSNLKLVSGIMPLKELTDREILVSIGTDGAQSNNSLDLLKDLKIGVLIQKQQYNDATYISAKEALKMITINGAKALHMDHEIGSLERGKKADIIALDIQDANINPLHRSCVNNIYSAVVYTADGSNVSDVIVNGKILMRNSELLNMNKAEIINQSHKAAEEVLKKAGLIK